MKTRSFTQSFGFALAGLWATFTTQRNMRIHGLLSLVAFAVALLLGFKPWEWGLLSITVTAVLVAEAFNTALETTLNIVTTQHHPQVGLAKNIAAGAVLLTALNALLVGIVLYGRYFLLLLGWLS